MSALLYELHSRERTMLLYLRWIRDKPTHKDAALWRIRVSEERAAISSIINLLIPNENAGTEIISRDDTSLHSPIQPELPCGT